MRWDYILGGASGAGLILIFGVLFLEKYLERAVDGRFEHRIENLRNQLTRKLEFDKSELAVWAELRKDILAQVWSANRDIIRSMTAVIMRVQDVQWKNRKLETLKPAIEEYRRVVHASLDLSSPKAVDLCQRFLMTAYEIFEAKRLPEDGNPLKAIRYEFTIELGTFFGLEKMMPWMAGKATI